MKNIMHYQKMYYDWFMQMFHHYLEWNHIKISNTFKFNMG
jgi:hypothetical protein